MAPASATTGRSESPQQREPHGGPAALSGAIPIDAPNIPTAALGDSKRLATLAARAALHGYTCTRTAADNIVIGRNGAGWIFGTIEAADAWLDRLQQPSTEVPA